MTGHGGPLHAGLVAIRLDQRWLGVLIEGPSGAGKSDLALRLLDLGARLVADDRVILWVSGGRLYGRAPDPLVGLLEVRGVGILPRKALDFAEIGLVLHCAADPAEVERMPENERTDRLGIDLPLRRLWPPEPAAPRKLLILLEQLGRRP